MFRVSSVGKNLLALMLLLTFFFSWAACVFICGEITERHPENQTTVSDNRFDADDCQSLSSVTEGCPMTATAAIIEARQLVKLTALSSASVAVLQYRAPHRAWSALLPEIRQNSPPKKPPAPLFVRFCNFRI